MGRIEKTVFISYRHTNFYCALAIFQDLSQHGFDVFFDFTGIASGDFESAILENLKTRAHFVVLLTPSALERCGEPGDWLRREVETALATRRNIVPLMLDNFDFGAPGIGNQLTGDLEALKDYQGLRVVPEYFKEGMDRLRSKYLNVPLDAVHHPVPASAKAKQAAKEQQAAAAEAPTVKGQELTAIEWFERGIRAADLEDQIRCYSEAIHLDPEYAAAFNNRGAARRNRGDMEGALQDYNEAIRLKRDMSEVFYNRGNILSGSGDLDGAIKDYDDAIRLRPNYAAAFNNRGNSRARKGDLDGSLQDLTEAIRLKPDFAEAFSNRGNTRRLKGDLDGSLQDLTEAIRLKPDYAHALFTRGLLHTERGETDEAIRDFQRCLDLPGEHGGNREEVEQRIRALRALPLKQAKRD
jgi:tetratricopeptide (TPR) repeat protein